MLVEGKLKTKRPFVRAPAKVPFACHVPRHNNSFTYNTAKNKLQDARTTSPNRQTTIEEFSLRRARPQPKWGRLRSRNNATVGTPPFTLDLYWQMGSYIGDYKKHYTGRCRSFGLVSLVALTISQWKVLVIDEAAKKIIDNVVKEDDILNENIASMFLSRGGRTV